MTVSLIVKNVTQIKSGITISVSVRVKIQKNIVCVKQILFWILQHVVAKNGKYVESIFDNSVITSDEIIKETKTVSTKAILTKRTSTNFYFSLAFLSITSVIDGC